MIDNIARGMAMANSNYSNKIRTNTFTSIASNTTNVPIGIPYDSITDNLEVVDVLYGDLLQLGIDYTLNINKISINLVVGINIGEKILFKIYKK